MPPVFFFQAEDGIRDLTVTGVQTCALPISQRRRVECRIPARLGHAARLRGEPPGRIDEQPQHDVALDLLVVQPRRGPDRRGRGQTPRRPLIGAPSRLAAVPRLAPGPPPPPPP